MRAKRLRHSYSKYAYMGRFYSRLVEAEVYSSLPLTMRKPFFVTGPHNIVFVAAIVGCLICSAALFHQWYFESEIRILAVENACEQPLNNRCQYEYLAEHKDGTLSRISFDIYMFRKDELAVGSSIKKSKFSFEYQMNGRKMAWGFAGHYLKILFFSLLALGLWRYLTPKPEIPKFVPEKQ